MRTEAPLGLAEDGRIESVSAETKLPAACLPSSRRAFPVRASGVPDPPADR